MGPRWWWWCWVLASKKYMCVCVIRLDEHLEDVHGGGREESGEG